MICAINFRDYVAPLAESLREAIHMGNIQDDPQTWESADFFSGERIDVLVPPNARSVDWTCVLVTEASSHSCAGASPELLRRVYLHYRASLLWAGFNMIEQKQARKVYWANCKILFFLGRCSNDYVCGTSINNSRLCRTIRLLLFPNRIIFVVLYRIAAVAAMVCKQICPCQGTRIAPSRQTRPH